MTTNPLAPVKGPEPVLVRRPGGRPSNEEIAAWILVGGLIIYVMFARVVPAVVGGLALYLILDRLSHTFSKRLPGTAARPLALILVTLVGGGFIIGAIAFAVSFLRHHVDRVPAVMTEMANILQSTRAWLGGYGDQIIPEVMTDAENIKGAMAEWLKTHAGALKVAGGTFSIGVVHLIMGMLLAIMVFFRHVTHHDDPPRGALAAALVEKVERFAASFSQIATAQIKISAMNTLLTGLYLFVVLPMFGKRLPFSTTIVLITFICGLIPVLGNLISNTVIVILSLGISVGTAIASLTFLVLIHKLEYLINSRIVGGHTDSEAWEILLAILLGETAFGVSGVVMAPIVYAFVKGELRDRGLI
jgi:predicted PurR-regulated permease PerM